VTGQAKPPCLTRLYRRVRFDYLKILRTRGAPAKVARGVGYGIFVELLFFPTLGVAFVLIYPLNRLGDGHTAASIASFVFAKLFAWITILPSIFLGAWLMGTEMNKSVVKDTVNTLVLKWGMIDATSNWIRGASQNPQNLAALEQLWSFIYAWIIGGVILGAVIGFGGYLICLNVLNKKAQPPSS